MSSAGFLQVCIPGGKRKRRKEKVLKMGLNMKEYKKRWWLLRRGG